jgi:hypothetical protein
LQHLVDVHLFLQAVDESPCNLDDHCGAVDFATGETPDRIQVAEQRPRDVPLIVSRGGEVPSGSDHGLGVAGR